MTGTEFNNCIAYGPTMPQKKCLTLHPALGEGCIYVLAGEIYRVDKVISTANYERREQCKVFVMGNSFLVKETAEEVLGLLGWSAE